MLLKGAIRVNPVIHEFSIPDVIFLFNTKTINIQEIFLI